MTGGMVNSSSSRDLVPKCRICWCTAEESGESFLEPTPCACRDERTNVHQSCLERWITEARNMGQFEAGTRCHACGGKYSHPLLEPVLRGSVDSAKVGLCKDSRIPLAIIGGTGYVGRCLAIHLLDHPLFRLGAIVGSSATVGKPFSAVFEKKEEALVEHYGADLWKPLDFPSELLSMRVMSLDEVIEAGECKMALSFIAPEHGKLEDRLAASGLKVFSISPHARFDPANPLSVPEANPEVLAEAARLEAGQRLSDDTAIAGSDDGAEVVDAEDGQEVVGVAPPTLVKSPNCVTCGCVVALKALDDAYGVSEVSVTTFQSLSGRGDAKYPRDNVMGNVYPLHNTVEKTGEYQYKELKRILPGVERVSVAAYRVPVQRGHLVDLRVRTRHPIASAADVEHVFSQFDPLCDVPLPSKPRRAIYVRPEGLDDVAPRAGAPRPKDDCDFEGGMSVVVGNVVCDDDMYDVRFCLVVNNLVRGAYGAALLNAEYWHWLTHQQRPSSLSSE